MKKCALSAIAGALAMLVALIIMANISTAWKQEPQEYEHIDYVSNITQEECFVCGESSAASCYWGDDNVGIVNLNTFELLHLEINRYDDQGGLIEEPAGYMYSSGLIANEAESCVYAPDQAYAHVQITGVQCAIDRDSIQDHLCQNCLDSINNLCFTDQPPAEFASVSFENRTIRTLLNSHPWFLTGNYGIDCEFKSDGAVDLLVHYMGA